MKTEILHNFLAQIVKFGLKQNKVYDKVLSITLLDIEHNPITLYVIGGGHYTTVKCNGKEITSGLNVAIGETIEDLKIASIFNISFIPIEHLELIDKSSNTLFFKILL